MTLTDCQLLSIVAQLGTFAAAAERLHITPSAVSHAVSGVEAECGFPLFTRTKSGVTLTAAAEKRADLRHVEIAVRAGGNPVFAAALFFYADAGANPRDASRHVDRR